MTTYFVKNVAVSGFGSLSETDPGATTMVSGWVVAKLAAGNFSKLQYGTEKASATFSTTNALTTAAVPSGGDSFRSENTINGSFANANWTFTFKARAVTIASSQAGRVSIRLWRGSNAAGTGATQITSSVLVGTTSAAMSTTVDGTSTVTFTPGAVITLTNEYLFVQLEWETTTAGGSNTADVDIRASASQLVTSTFTPGAQDLDPPFYDNPENFKVPTVVSTYDLDPPLYDNPETLFPPAALSIYDLDPPLYTNDQTFYAPEVAGIAAQNLAPPLLINVQNFLLGDPYFFLPDYVDLAAALQTLTPVLFSNAQAFYVPSVGAGSVDISPAKYTNTITFYSPVVGTGELVLFPNPFTNPNTFYTPALTTGSVDIAPAKHTNTQTFYAPTVGAGAITLTPALYTNAQTFYTPAVLDTANVAPALFTNAQTFPPATVISTIGLSPSLHTNNQIFYAPSVGAGQVDIKPPFFTNANTLYPPVVSGGAAIIAPAKFDNANAFYAPTIGSTVNIAPALYTNAQVFYTPAFTTTVNIAPAKFNNVNSFFAPTVAFEGAPAGAAFQMHPFLANIGQLMDHSIAP